jgi:hypothetical protein
LFWSAAEGQECRHEDHDDYRCASTDSEAPERLAGFHGEKVAQGDHGLL